MNTAVGSPWAFSVIPSVFNVGQPALAGSRRKAGTLAVPDVTARSACRGRAGAQGQLLLTRESSSGETGRFWKQPSRGRGPRVAEPIATPKHRNLEGRSR